VAALLDKASRSGSGAAFYPLESLPALGPAARERLLEVAGPALERSGPERAFAVRALGKAGARAAAPLARLIGADSSTDAERADAARSLATIGSPAQAELSRSLSGRARALLDTKDWLSTGVGVVLTLLEGLEPKQADRALLEELSRLPLAGEPPPVVRRKVMLRCRAAALLADRASLSAPLAECDPAPPAERRQGALALLSVLGRGPLSGARGVRFRELAQSADRVVREAALELLMTHDEVERIPELLANALGAKEVGVRATAAQVLARYPARAQLKASGEPAASPPTDPRVVQELTRQLGEVGKTSNIELSSWLLDAASALELLGAKPALERACGSPNPTLRRHAEQGFAQLGERQHRCPSTPSHELWQTQALPDYRLELSTDIGPLTLTLWGNASPFATQRLVELSRAHFFDGMAVHRVVPGFVVQLGDPDGDGFGGPDLPPLRCQVSSDPFELYSVGIALAGRDTGSSQFFVALRSAPHLAGEYSLVGHADPGWERLAPGDRILEVRVLEAGSK
jgi:cyclophilin family peptidyl-prolyl cis-trans isomerase